MNGLGPSTNKRSPWAGKGASMMTEPANRGNSSSGVVGRRGALTWPLLLVAALCLVALVALFGGRGAGAQTAAVPTEEDGSVVGWGLNTSGQTTIPTGLSGVKAIAGGGSHSLALKEDGSVVAWGYNGDGRATVPDGASSGVKAIAGGTAHSLALKEDGSVVAWGYNEYGQTDVPTAAQSGVKAIDAGFLHSLALKEDGSVVAWGFYYGRGFATVPTAAQSGVKAIASGDDHSLALKEDGSVVAWGFNDFGQGTVTIVPDGAKSGVKAIAGGGKHSLALKEDGSVVAWGSNGQGQTTVPDGAKSGVKAIAGGLYHSLALKEDGSVVAWGYNENGQTTVPAGANSGVKAIAGGDYHSLALTPPDTTAPPPDTTAPNTAISNGPTEGSTVTSTNQAFSFTSTESDSTFKCSINGAVVFSACSAGDTFAFAEGSNTFEVKATDTAGNEDPSPATRAFTVDTIAPDAPSITSPDDNSFDTDGAITLSGAAEAESTVEVFEGDASRGSTTANGSGEWTKTLTNVADGSHTYKAKATDAVGNASGFSNTRTVTVDTAAPDTTIISGPTEGAKVNATSQAFSFDSTEAGSTFECSVNGAAFSACSTGETLTFTEGSNTFEVVATDADGNEDSSAATRTFTVDTTAPDTIITDGPSGTVNSTSATFEFSSRGRRHLRVQARWR